MTPTIEQINALYFDSDALRESPYVLYRIDGSGNRYYYHTGADGTPVFYPSITSVIAATLPKDEYIIKWIAELGYDQAREFRDQRADYGTILHILISRFIIDREIDLEGIAALYPDHAENLCSDVLSFAQFCNDYQITPLAVEIGVVDESLGIAGFLDLACRMTIQVDGLDHNNPYKSGARKGQPREVKIPETITAIVDFKSGKKGFYEAHEIQVNWYRDTWNAMDLGAEATHCFNWAPKDWRTAPTYTLKDQTGAGSYAKLPHLKACFDIDHSEGKPRPIREYTGTVTFGQPLDDNFTATEIEQYIMKRNTEEVDA